MIDENNGEFTVMSEDGKALSKPYTTKDEATKRQKQIDSLPTSSETALYKGETVGLNSPFVNDKLDYSVYSKNQTGDVVLVRFNGTPANVESKDKSTPSYWNALLAGSAFKDFKQKAFFDMSNKTIRSVRDGVQEYMGIEIGEEPADKIFTIYRSPETITAIAGEMGNLPIINDHIDPSITPTKEQTIGLLESPEVVQFDDSSTNTTLCLENKASFSNEAIKLKDSGKIEFSLGYLGKLREHDVYDFEQYDLNPTHLALVDNARGGSGLTFIDNKENEMALSKIFTDEQGAVNLSKITEVAKGIKEAIKTLPTKDAAAAKKSILSIMDMDKKMEDMDDKEIKDMEADEEEMMDEKMEDEKLTDEKDFEDSQKFKDALQQGIDSAVKLNGQVITKAKGFLDETYSFGDKSTNQIMRDALATEYGNQTFEDAELVTAFKMLKRSGSLEMKFEDKNSLDARIEKQLENK